MTTLNTDFETVEQSKEILDAISFAKTHFQTALDPLSNPEIGYYLDDIGAKNRRELFRIDYLDKVSKYHFGAAIKKLAEVGFTAKEDNVDELLGYLGTDRETFSGVAKKVKYVFTPSSVKAFKNALNM